MTYRFTGRQMASSLVAFFAVVVGVNATMATLAARSFGGVVVDNSYVASQQFNGWLGKAHARDALGWRSRVTVDDGHPVIEAWTRAGPLTDAELLVDAKHPLGRLPDKHLRLREIAPGRYRSDIPLPPGRWQLRAMVSRAGVASAFVADVRA